MAYQPYYSGGWQSGTEGNTPITPAALNNIEDGISDVDNALSQKISLSDVILRFGELDLGTLTVNERGSTTITFQPLESGTSYMVLVMPVLGDIGCGVQERNDSSFRLYYRNNDSSSSRSGKIYWAIIKLP